MAQEGRPVLGTQGSCTHGDQDVRLWAFEPRSSFSVSPPPASFQPSSVCNSKACHDDEVHILFELSSRHAHRRAIRLFVNLVEDALAEVTYDADLAGLSYSVSNDDDGIVVSVGGYNDKLDVLLRTVLEKLRNLEVAPDRLKVIAEKVGQLVSAAVAVPLLMPSTG